MRLNRIHPLNNLVNKLNRNIAGLYPPILLATLIMFTIMMINAFLTQPVESRIVVGAIAGGIVVTIKMFEKLFKFYNQGGDI